MPPTTDAKEMIRKINSTMNKIQSMGHSEDEYTKIFRLLNDAELALLEKMEFLHKLSEGELGKLYALVNKIMQMLVQKFPKPNFSRMMTA